MKCEKPMRGDAARLKRARRRRIETTEAQAKAAAKARDAYFCRRCRTYWGVEAAHLVDKGMGGDHGRHSHHQRQFITLCRLCHQGPRSVHSAHIRLVFDPVLMGDGPVEFVTVVPGTTAGAPRVKSTDRGNGAAVPNSTRTGMV